MTTPDVTAPRVSAIIAAHNAGAFVGQAISSALASRGVVLEVIVVDDESTDDTWDILEGFGPEIRKVRQPRGGPYKARNLGASLARGEWLAFLDADDHLARPYDLPHHRYPLPGSALLSDYVADG